MRGPRVNSDLWRMARAVGIEARPDLAADLRVELREELDPHVGHLEALVRDTTARALGLDGTGGTVHENAQLMLRVAYDRAREQLSVEIDLFVLSLEAAPSTAPPGGGSATFNVYAPVGAIVTGAGASASVVQTLGTEDRRVIVEALDCFAETIRADRTLTAETRRDVIELVQDGQAEFRKERPNSLRVASVLTGLAVAVQTVAAIQPAYAMLKAALLPYGITLP